MSDSHNVRLDKELYIFLKNAQRVLNERKRGQRKTHKYSLSEVIEWYINAALGEAALPIE